MTPPKSSRTIPKLGQVLTRSRATNNQVNSDDVPEPIASSSTTSAAPQYPLSPQSEIRRAVTDRLALVDEKCEKQVDPLTKKITELENGLATTLAVNEDVRTRIGLLEGSKKTVGEIKEQMDGITSTKEQTKEIINLFKGLKSEWETGLTSLRKDVNRILEDNSTSREVLQDTAQEEYENETEEDKKLSQSSQQVTFSTPNKDRTEQGDDVSAKPSSSKPSSRKTRSKKSTRTAPRSGTNRRHDDSDGITSSEDTSEYETENVASDNEAHTSFYERDKGQKYRGLASLVPTNRRYNRLMSYLYYRLKKTSTRSIVSNGKLRRTLKDLELTFKDHKFSGEDPILVFDFLTRIFDEADMLGLTEGQMFTIFPNMVTGMAATQYRATLNGSRRGGVTSWPEAVQYFLRTYATTSAIRTATHQFRNLLQMTNEDEVTFATIVNHATFRCGNVHDEDEMTVFIDGLGDCTRTTVARIRDEQFRHEMNFERLVHYAKDEGDSFLARLGINHRRYNIGKNIGTGSGPSRLRSTRSSSQSALSILNSTTNDNDQLLLVDDGSTNLQDSIPTTDLPSTTHEEELNQLNEKQEQLLFSRTPVKRVRPPRVSLDTNQKPGWIDRKEPPVCYGCYVVGDHILPKCNVGGTQYQTVINIYDKLTDAQKQRLPDRTVIVARHTKQLLQKMDTAASGNDTANASAANPSPAPKNG